MAAQATYWTDPAAAFLRSKSLSAKSLPIPMCLRFRKSTWPLRENFDPCAKRLPASRDFHSLSDSGIPFSRVRELSLPTLPASSRVLATVAGPQAHFGARFEPALRQGPGEIKQSPSPRRNGRRISTRYRSGIHRRPCRRIEQRNAQGLHGMHGKNSPCLPLEDRVGPASSYSQVFARSSGRQPLSNPPAVGALRCEDRSR